MSHHTQLCARHKSISDLIMTTGKSCITAMKYRPPAGKGMQVVGLVIDSKQRSDVKEKGVPNLCCWRSS